MNAIPLTSLTPGQQFLVGTGQVVEVTPELASAFRPGDRLVPVAATGDLLHVPAGEWELAAGAVRDSVAAFRALQSCSDAQIDQFYRAFAARLEQPSVWLGIAEANQQDLDAARARGRSTTRLAVSDRMRAEMIAGLLGWSEAPSQRGRVLEEVVHPEGWKVELFAAPLGPVGFVFEARPNVFADATGVLRGGNTVLLRIGSDALGTARAIVSAALRPALRESGLPEGSVQLLDSGARACGWALFSQPGLALAVARGSGSAVAQLGAVARQAGVPVSLHGTGGAWMIAGPGADAATFEAAVEHSLDRKVCNTLNVCCVVESRAGDLVPAFLRALEAAGNRRGHGSKLHVARGSQEWVPAEWFAQRIAVRRAEGSVDEARAELLETADLGREWEWEETPEVSLLVAPGIEEAVDLANQFSPQFVASLLESDPALRARFEDRVNAPFLGNGFTRWVDGQYALCRPELGLSNWESGRLFARGGVLSGDSVYTIRTRMTQVDPHQHR